MLKKYFHKLFLWRQTYSKGVTDIYTHYLMYYIRIVRQVTGLLLSNLCQNIIKKLIRKFTDIFPNQVLSFLNIFTEQGKIIADYTKSIEIISQLLCRNLIVERLPYLFGYKTGVSPLQNDYK